MCHIEAEAECTAPYVHACVCTLCVLCVLPACLYMCCLRCAVIVLSLCCHCAIAAVHAGVSGQVLAAIHGPSDRYSTGAAVQALPLGTFSPSSPSINQSMSQVVRSIMCGCWCACRLECVVAL